MYSPVHRFCHVYEVTNSGRLFVVICYSQIQDIMEETLPPVVARERYFLAARTGDLKGIKDSLENSAKHSMDIDSVDANGRSALHIAIANGNLGE